MMEGSSYVPKLHGVLPLLQPRLLVLGVVLCLSMFINWIQLSAYQVPYIAFRNISRTPPPPPPTTTTATKTNNPHLQVHPKYNRSKHNLVSNDANFSHLERLKHPTAIICAIMKDDERYMQEWLDYYFGVLPFDHIYLYDNSDNFTIATWMEENELVQQYRDRISLFWVPGLQQQMPAYQECGARAKAKNHTYALFIDQDEYLMLHSNYTTNIIKFCRKYVPRGYLALERYYFGNSGQQTYLPLPVTFRFQCRVNAYDSYIKSLVRVMDLDHKKMDSPHTQPLLNGTRINIEPSLAVINHYFYKTPQEYIEKRSRGSGASPPTITAFHLNLAMQGLGPDGKPQPAGDIRDGEVWERFKRFMPRYAEYENHPLVKNLTRACYFN